MTGFIFAVSPEEFWSISIYPLVSGSKEADSITPESIWLLKDKVDENLKFPFIKAEFLSDELTSINKGAFNFLKFSPIVFILKSEGAEISVKPITYPSFDSIIICSKSIVLIAFNPVCEEY